MMDPTMRNRAEKDAVRWCHLTHQVIAGASVAEVYPYFVSKRFINHIIINKSCQTCPAHIVKWYNAKTGVTATLLTIIFESKRARLKECFTGENTPPLPCYVLIHLYI